MLSPNIVLHHRRLFILNQTPNFKMNKMYGIVALAGYLGLSAINPAILSAQGNNEPIKFGSNRQVKYIPTPLESQEYIALLRGNYPPVTPENWGKISVDESTLTLWGALDGTSFSYLKDEIAGVLEIKKDGKVIRYVDYSSNDYRHDEATVNGQEVLVRSPDFFETTKPLQIPITPEDRLVSILGEYRQRLNISAAERQAKSLRKVITPQELKQSLDVFVK